jgi:hypothetical protein
MATGAGQVGEQNGGYSRTSADQRLLPTVTEFQPGAARIADYERLSAGS